MPVVTSVEPQKSSKGRSAYGRKTPKRFNIFLDGQFAFGADEDLVVNFRLTFGKILQKEDLEKILFEAEVGKLMERMHGLFSIRQRSEKEVRDYLRLRNFKLKVKAKEEISGLVIESLIEKLKEKELINDLEFAKTWMESRQRSKGKSKRMVYQELIKKGINKETIEEVLDGSLANEEELAKKALEKRLKAWKNLQPQEFKEKACEFLLRKGFDYSLIKKVVEDSSIFSLNNEHETPFKNR